MRGIFQLEFYLFFYLLGRKNEHFLIDLSASQMLIVKLVDIHRENL